MPRPYGDAHLNFGERPIVQSGVQVNPRALCDGQIHDLIAYQRQQRTGRGFENTNACFGVLAL